jgi:hypothetical protein
LSRSCFSRLVAPFFSHCGGTPIHPFVDPPAVPAVVQGVRDALTPSSLLRPSRGRRPSQSKKRSATEAESIDNFRLALGVHEGLFFQGRRADATALLPLVSSFVSRKGSRQTPSSIQFLCLAKRSRALLGSNPMRNNQAEVRQGAFGLWREFPAPRPFFFSPLGHLAMPPKIRLSSSLVSHHQLCFGFPGVRCRWDGPPIA